MFYTRGEINTKQNCDCFSRNIRRSEVQLAPSHTTRDPVSCVDLESGHVVVRGERGVQTRIWALSPPVKEFGRFSDSTVEYVRFSPDGLRFATVGPSVESVRLWRTIGGEEDSTLKTKREKFDDTHHDRIVAINPTGEFLAVAGTADEVWLCVRKGGRRLATLPHKGMATK
jgi:WD40 repeat protein